MEPAGSPAPICPTIMSTVTRMPQLDPLPIQLEAQVTSIAQKAPCETKEYIESQCENEQIRTYDHKS